MYAAAGRDMHQVLYHRLSCSHAPYILLCKRSLVHMCVGHASDVLPRCVLRGVVVPRASSLHCFLLATGHDLNTVTKLKERVHVLIIDCKICMFFLYLSGDHLIIRKKMMRLPMLFQHAHASRGIRSGVNFNFNVQLKHQN